MKTKKVKVVYKGIHRPSDICKNQAGYSAKNVLIENELDSEGNVVHRMHKIPVPFAQPSNITMPFAQPSNMALKDLFPV